MIKIFDHNYDVVHILILYVGGDQEIIIVRHIGLFKNKMKLNRVKLQGMVIYIIQTKWQTLPYDKTNKTHQNNFKNKNDGE